MQANNRSSRILLPVKRWFVAFTLLAALVLAMIPTGQLPGMPDWVALVLAFWCIREPLKVGMGVAFVAGLVVDLGQGSALGQHALSYVLLAYTAARLSRRVLWFPMFEQSLHVLPMFLATQMLMVAVRLVAGDEFPGWWYFLGSLTAAVLWAPLSVLLLLPQYQPAERDDNRPI